MLMKSKRTSSGQIFLITVFVISVAMFSSLLALAPVRTKIIQIKEMEYVYQAMANAEKAIEIFSYFSNYGDYPFSSELSITTTTSQTQSCAFYTTTTLADCRKTIITSNDSKFKILNYYFSTGTNMLLNASFFFGYTKNISRALMEIMER